MNKDIKQRVFNTFFIILFVIFLTMYITTNSNYYEYKMHENTYLTEEKIKEFESDIASGVDIDLNNYLNDTKKDYSNKISDISSKISKNTGNCVKNGIRIVFDILKKYFS